MDDKFTNTDLNPIDIYDYPWLYESDIRFLPSKIHNTGKWMLFYDKNLMNEKWSVCKTLYKESKLNGVFSMKCSTSYDNSRASSKNGVIILYCNNSEDKETIMKIGENIKRLTSYPQTMSYKTDEQTRIGTRATGNKINHIYKIQ